MPPLPARAVPGEVAGLPRDLAGPVGVALAKPSARMVGAESLPGGCLYEPKWDGFRMVIVRGRTRARLWSKQGRELTGQFPEVAAAATALRPGTVVDGEVVIWHGDRLDFALLQRRNVSSPTRTAALVTAHPASYVAFDLLADAGFDMRGTRLLDRRVRLEALAQRWAPPLHLTPATTDPAEAARWFVDYRPAGVEGLVVKSLTGRYRAGRREWLKVKSRETTEVIVGGVLGPLNRPAQLVVGRYRTGTLTVVGRTSPLTAAQAAEAAAVLSVADVGHPWPTRVGTGQFGGGRLAVQMTRVRPDVVVEVSADTALSGECSAIRCAMCGCGPT